MEKGNRLTILLVVVAAAATYHYWLRTYIIGPNDFMHTWIGSQYVHRTGDPRIFGKDGDAKVNEFACDPASGLDPLVTDMCRAMPPATYLGSPFLHAVIFLISGGDYRTDLTRFMVLSLIALIFSFAVLARWLGYDLESALALWSIMVLLFGPLLSDAANVNINRLQLAGLTVALGCLSARRGYGSLWYGVLCGLLIVLKPNIILAPALLAFSRVIRRQWKDLLLETGGGVAGVLLGLAAGSVFFGSFSSWSEWGASIAAPATSDKPVSMTNFSLPVMLQELALPDLSRALLVLGILWAAWRLAWFSRLDAPTRGGGGTSWTSFALDLRIFAAGLLVYHLGSRLVWSHYYALTLPMVMVVLAPATQSSLSGGGRTLSWLSVILVATPAAEYFIIPYIAAGMSMWVGTALLFLTGTTRRQRVGGSNTLESSEPD